MHRYMASKRGPAASTPPNTMNISDTIKNARKQGANRPFGEAKMIKQPAKQIDPALLEICNDPIPSHRASPGNKYEAVLKTMKIGQCIKCPPEAVGSVAGAVRKWITVNKLPATVKSMTNFGDGSGRVWMLGVEKKLKVAA